MNLDFQDQQPWRRYNRRRLLKRRLREWLFKAFLATLAGFIVTGALFLVTSP